LAAPLLAWSAFTATSCAPVCRGVDGACVELHIEGSGSYSSYSIEWRYAISDEPKAALRRGATESGGDLPRIFRVLPPLGVPHDSVRSVGVLGLSGDGSEEVGGSIELSLGSSEHATQTLPLGLRFSRNDIALAASSANLVAADLNGDSVADLAVVGTPVTATANSTSGGVLSVLYGVGDGTYRTAVRSDIPTEARSLQAVDVDGDSRLDLLTTGAGDSFSLFLNSSSGLAAAGSQILNSTGVTTGDCGSSNGTATDAHSLAVADFNGDGFVDIAATLRSRPCLTLLLGTSKTAFVAKETAPRPSPVPVGDALSRMAVADFDQDGRPDVAVIRTTEGIGNIALLLSGDTQNGFSLSSVFTAGNEPTGLLAEDFNRDGKPDLAVVSARSSSLQVFLNKGFVSGAFGGSPASVTHRPADLEHRFGLPGYGPTCIASGDINGDGTMDLAVCDSALPTIAVLFGRSGSTLAFEPPIRLAVEREPRAIVVADLDGKGQRDLAVVHAGSATLTVLLNRTN